MGFVQKWAVMTLMAPVLMVFLATNYQENDDRPSKPTIIISNVTSKTLEIKKVVDTRNENLSKNAKEEWFSQLNVAYTEVLPDLTQQPQEMVNQFESQLHNFPETKEDLFLCNKSKTCHLDRNCYGTIDAPFHPIGCKSQLFSNHQAMTCLQKRPLVIIGDSRAFELFTGVRLTMLNLFHVKKVNQEISPDGKEYTFTHQETGQLLTYYPGRTFMYSEVNVNWTRLSAMVAHPEVGLNLVVGGLGAHIVALDERAPEFDTNLRNHLEQLRTLLKEAEQLKAKKVINEIIYFSDATPMRLIHQSRYKFEAVGRLNMAAWDLLRREFPQVKVWDSHMQASEIQAHICENFLLKETLPEDIWMTGVAQMLLNHMCPPKHKEQSYKHHQSTIS